MVVVRNEDDRSMESDEKVARDAGIEFAFAHQVRLWLELNWSHVRALSHSFYTVRRL
jgi:hypothetical protein